MSNSNSSSVVSVPTGEQGGAGRGAAPLRRYTGRRSLSSNNNSDASSTGPVVTIGSAAARGPAAATGAARGPAEAARGSSGAANSAGTYLNSQGNQSQQALGQASVSQPGQQSRSRSKLNIIYPLNNGTLNEAIRKKTKKIKGTTTPNRITDFVHRIGRIENDQPNVVIPSQVDPTNAYNRFEFNLMYLIDPNISKKYYEVYTSYQMLLNVMDNIRYFLTMNRNELYQMVSIRETIDMKRLVYKQNIITKRDRPENVVPLYSYFAGGTLDISYLFGDGLQPNKVKGIKQSISDASNVETARDNGKKFRKEVSDHFKRYRSQQSLFSFEDVGRSQMPIFQYIIKNYIENRTLKEILLDMCDSYTMFKMKILETMGDSQTNELLFGLMTYGFLFSNKYFPKIHSTDPNNIFMDPVLYDLGEQKVDINQMSMKLSKRIFEIGDNLKNKLNYFYSGEYRDTILFELIMTAMDMDLAGLQVLLYYAHPEYLRLFLKRKEYIDRQISNYIGSFDVEDISTGFKDIGIYKSFIDDPSGLFKTYPQFLDPASTPAAQSS